MPSTVQHAVQEPQVFPGTMPAEWPICQSSSGYGALAGAGLLRARLAARRFASPIGMSHWLDRVTELPDNAAAPGRTL